MVEQLLTHPIVAPLVVAFITGVAGWFVLLKRLEMDVRNLKESMHTKFVEVDKRIVLLEENIKIFTELQNKTLTQLQVLETKLEFYSNQPSNK